MKEQGFFIPGPLPGLNEMLDARGLGKRTGARRPNRYNDLKRKWESLICMEIARQKVKPVGNHYVRLRFLWCEPNRRRDPDNIAAAKKLILDALVLAGILVSDSQAWVKGWEDRFFEPDSKEPGVFVVVEKYEMPKM